MAKKGCICTPREPTLDELLADDIMEPVLQSAGYDRERFHDLLAETGKRFKESREE